MAGNKLGSRRTPGNFSTGIGKWNRERRGKQAGLWRLEKFGRGQGCLKSRAGKQSRAEHCVGQRPARDARLSTGLLAETEFQIDHTKNLASICSMRYLGHTYIKRSFIAGAPGWLSQ